MLALGKTMTITKRIIKIWMLNFYELLVRPELYKIIYEASPNLISGFKIIL
jgi:hypothetical protein